MRRGAFAFVLIVLASHPGARGAEVSPEPGSLERSILRWISDWDQPSFSVRNSASRQLRDVGSLAFPAVVEAARRGKQETVARSLALLKSFLYSEDEALKQSARTSLDQIANGPNLLAAKSARQVLKDFDRPSAQSANMQAFLPQQQMAFPPGFGGRAGNIARQINTWTFNGTTKLEAHENDVKIKIEQDANGRIKVELTQRRQGNDVTDKYEAANPAELKTKHPVAHQAYRRYEASLQQAKAIGQRAFTPPAQLGPNLNVGNARARTLQIYEQQIETLQRLIPQAPSREVAESLNRNLQRNIEVRDQLRRELGPNR